MYYNSTIKWISQYMFETKEEVILANAISINCENNCTSDEFIQKFKFTCRILGIKSKWVE